MRARRLQWGILGTARVTRHLIPALHASARSTLVAVASRTRARAEARAAEGEVPRAVEGGRADRGRPYGRAPAPRRGPDLRDLPFEAVSSQEVERMSSTVLWRLQRPGTERAHAVVLPGGPPFTVAFFVNERLDRVENYDTMDLALFRAESIRQAMMREAWTDAS